MKDIIVDLMSCIKPRTVGCDANTIGCGLPGASMTIEVVPPAEKPAIG
jgi:hypothetical protein